MDEQLVPTFGPPPPLPEFVEPLPDLGPETEEERDGRLTAALYYGWRDQFTETELQRERLRVDRFHWRMMARVVRVRRARVQGPRRNAFTPSRRPRPRRAASCGSRGGSEPDEPEPALGRHPAFRRIA